MRHIAIRGIFAALLLVSSLYAFAESPNLCTEQEDPVFACPLENKKLVSVCALYDSTQKSGYRYLVYRYGTKEKIELSFPDKPMEFRRLTSVDETLDYKPTDDGQFIRFMNGKISYVVYVAAVHNTDLAGVAVLDGYKLLSNIKCQPDSADFSLQQNFIVSIGAQLEDADKALRFWKLILPGSSTAVPQQSPSVPKK
jgi:hypothetical protein